MKYENKQFVFDKPMKIDYKYYIKLILFGVIDQLYAFLLLIRKPSSSKRKKKYGLVFCAIFKNESLSLREWLEYHLLMGVDHFYLYNNFSDDNYLSILEPYIISGKVTLTEWPVEKGQISAYVHFLTNYKDESEWLAFIDLDEYICPLQDTSLPSWLAQFKNVPSLLVYWKIFGTSGLFHHDHTKLIVEQYTVCSNKLNVVGKVFFNTDWEVHLDGKENMIHHNIYAKVSFLGRTFAIPSQNEFGKFSHRFELQRIPERARPTIQINHYVSKAYWERIRKHKRGCVYFGATSPTLTNEKLYYVENICNSVDYSIYRFMIQLKLRLNRKCDLLN